MNWFEWAGEHLKKWKTASTTFTPQAQYVFRFAREEAERRNHNFVGTEHLLLGLITLKPCVAGSILQKQGLNLEAIRLEVETLSPSSPPQKIFGNIPYTPRVKKVLALAQREAKSLNHTYVGTEHILLGLLVEGDGLAARVLKKFSVNIEQMRKEILNELTPKFSSDGDEQK
jgi:ATP-dependent Clp protease ATP-binding subunit ClpC